MKRPRSRTHLRALRAAARAALFGGALTACAEPTIGLEPDPPAESRGAIDPADAGHEPSLADSGALDAVADAGAIDAAVDGGELLADAGSPDAEADAGLATADSGLADGGALADAGNCGPNMDDWESFTACCAALGWDWERGCAAWGPPPPPAEGVA